MQIFTFKIAKKIIIGRKAFKQLAEEVENLGGKRALVVIDPVLKNKGIPRRIKNCLQKRGINFKIFDRVKYEPSFEIADRCASFARKNTCDIVIGVGGGSTMDIAKAVSALLTNKGNAEDYQGQGLLKNPSVPKIMVPTTAGTGSEVTPTAVFIKNSEKVKRGINSPYLIPDVALLDSELSLSIPSDITASTGMDAFTHALEAYTSRKATLITEGISLKAIEIIIKRLPQAVRNNTDIKVREDMLLASLLGGIALTNAGVGVCHSLSYPLSAICGIPHGLANAVLITHVMAYNLPNCRKKYSKITDILDRTKQGYTLDDKAKLLVEYVESFVREIGIAQNLRKLGVKRALIPRLAEQALRVTKPIENNPRRVTFEDLKHIYKAAF